MRKEPPIQHASPADQETLYVLHNPSLMEQIQRSLETHRQGKGYVPPPQELEAPDDDENA